MSIFRSLHRKVGELNSMGHQPGSVKRIGGKTYLVGQNGAYRKLEGKELEAVNKIIFTPTDQLLKELAPGG